MQIEDFLSAVLYKITEGSQFIWNCYGANAWYLDAEYASAVFDRCNGIVLEVSVHGETHDINHRWIHPEYLERYINESAARGCDPWQVYDDVQYTRVDSEDDILALVRARASTQQ